MFPFAVLFQWERFLIDVNNVFSNALIKKEIYISINWEVSIWNEKWNRFYFWSKLYLAYRKHQKIQHKKTTKHLNDYLLYWWMKYKESQMCMWTIYLSFSLTNVVLAQYTITLFQVAHIWFIALSIALRTFQSFFAHIFLRKRFLSFHLIASNVCSQCLSGFYRLSIEILNHYLPYFETEKVSMLASEAWLLSTLQGLSRTCVTKFPKFWRVENKTLLTTEHLVQQKIIKQSQSSLSSEPQLMIVGIFSWPSLRLPR